MDKGVLIFAALLLPLSGAALAPLAGKHLGHRAVYGLALFPLAAFLIFLSFLPSVAAGVPVVAGMDWVPSLGLRFSVFLDGLSLTFALLVTGIGTLIMLYCGGYMKGHAAMGRFCAFMLLFMAAMLGLVVSDGFLMLFVYWELTSITSFLLIGFDHERPAARRAAIQALVITGGGGLALLAGLLLITQITGANALSALLQTGDALRYHPLYLPALILVLGGAFTKSAQFPFHIWLPNAMEAPAPVSAFLHSATMVKAGVYLLMRLNPVMGHTVEWETILPVSGAATLVFGSVMAVRQTDLKRMLAFTTLASLGLLVLFIGYGTAGAVAAATLYLVAHSLFKGGLFMVAGVIDHETGTRDITRLGGLRRAMPLTFAIGLMAALSMAGLPPFFGFLAKEEIYAVFTRRDLWSVVLLLAVILGNGLMFAVALAIGWKPFAGGMPAALAGRHVHEAPFLLWFGPLVLALCGLAAAIAAPWVHGWISSPMASASAGEAVRVTIALAPHIGLPLLLSAVTIVLGALVLTRLESLQQALQRLETTIGWGPDRGFDQAMTGLIRFSFALTRRLQSGRLETYVTVTFLVMAASLLVPMTLYSEWPQAPVWPEDIRFHELAIFALAIVGLVSVLLAADRLTAIVSLGIQGFAVAMMFLIFGAPDLAFTQFMIETLSVVILALVMTRLNLRPSDHRDLLERIKDGAIALACAVGFAAFLMRATQMPFDNRLTDFFNLYSRTIAHGANVVNVIIVDFRGTDTLGEIAVVMDHRPCHSGADPHPGADGPQAGQQQSGRNGVAA